MAGTNNTKHSSSRRLVAVFLFFLAVSASAESVVDNASIEFEPERVVRGERFTIQIRTSIPWGEEVEIFRPELNGPMVWWAYPYARPWTVIGEDGSSVRMIEVLAAVRVDKPGFHLIEPFRIRAGDREAVTELKEVIGLEPDEEDFPYPVTTNWRAVPETFWQGQSIPVILEARNLVSLALADSTVLNTAPEGLLENTYGFGDIVTRPHGNDILYDVPMASWVWTLGEPGKYTFPGVITSVAGLNRATAPFQVEVKPLPESVLSSGAVGYFIIGSEWEDRDYRVGDIVSVRVRVEGSGNLNVLKLPVPEMTSASLVSQGSTSSYVPGPDGYEGWRVERYDFQIEDSGSLHISIPAWVWMEPEGNGQVRKELLETGVIYSEEALGDSGNGDADMLLGAEAFRYRPADFHWNNRYWFLLALPGFITLITIFIIRRPGVKGLAVIMVLPLLISSSSIGVKDSQKAAAAVRMAVNGDWEPARKEFEELLSTAGEIPGLLNDLAISEMMVGSPDKAVAFIRRALYLRPGSSRLTETMNLLEERFGLTDQIPVPLKLSPSVIFIIWLLAMNAFFLSLTWLMFRRNAKDVIFFVSAMFLLLVSSIGMSYMDRLWNQPTAVVKGDSEPLRKIPGPLATDWIQLPGGSAVSVTAFEGDDYLVRTGYGLEGWLPRSSLILVSETLDGF